MSSPSFPTSPPSPGASLSLTPGPDTEAPDAAPARALPPVLGRLLSGTFWLALRTPLAALFAFWSIPLQKRTFDDDLFGAYGFAWGFGFFQFLLEFGMSSALQREVSECWTKGDRKGVDRAIACGILFYAGVTVVQVLALLGVAYWALPHSKFATIPAANDFIIQLLWLQAFTAPCFGVSTIVSSILQAARKYDFIPRYELAIVILRFAALWFGIRLGWSYLAIIIVQTVIQVGLSLGPAIYVMVNELGYVPRLMRVKASDFGVLLHVSFFMFLMQLSVVLADKIDTTVLGFALDHPGRANSEYMVVSKPFSQIRQTGWMLAYLVMPAVASLVAAKDAASLDRLKYDGTRLHTALLLPVALLAGLYARPFLEVWIGPEYPGRVPFLATQLQLFLVATAPLVLAVPVQMSIGMGRIAPIAYAALAGSLINLPLSYFLTLRLGMPGVIWGTVLTTLFSNLLIPGIDVFRTLQIRPTTFLRRTLLPPFVGAAVLVAATLALHSVYPAETTGSTRWSQAVPLLIHLTVGCIAYAAGYLAVPGGRSDWESIASRVLRRFG